MQKYKLTNGQAETSETYEQKTSAQCNAQVDFLAVLEQIDFKKENPYLVLDLENGKHIQTLRSATGYIVECRYFFPASSKSKDWNTFIHYRAWNLQGHSNPGKADPRTGEWGTWIHERDHLNIYETASLLNLYSKSKDPMKLPKVENILWRDVTNEFPSNNKKERNIK